MNRYNSAILKALDSTDHDVLIVDKNFLLGTAYDKNTTHYNVKQQDYIYEKLGIVIGPPYRDSSLPRFIRDVPQMKSNLTRLENEQCIHQYSTRILTGHRNVLAIMGDKHSSVPSLANNITTGSLLFYHSALPMLDSSSHSPFMYICSGLPGFVDRAFTECSPNMIDAANSNLLGYKIDYCMSEIVDEVSLVSKRNIMPKKANTLTVGSVSARKVLMCLSCTLWC